MKACLFFTVACFITLRAAAQAPEKPAPKKLPPETEKLFQSTPEEFIKRFDKNMNGTLEKDELPPKLAERFEKVDTNGDGKLDRKEVAQWLSDIRKRLGIAEPGGLSPVEKMVNALLLQFDTNKDGKLSKDETKGRMAENFDMLDKNKDGFLDRAELRPIAEKILAQKKGPFPGFGPGAAVDFDALDKDADGRLTREELKGTRFLNRFEEIDTNHDGRIDRREFEAFLRKEADKNK